MAETIIEIEASKYMAASEKKIDRSQFLNKISKLVCFALVFLFSTTVFAVSDYPAAEKAYENGEYALAEKLFTDQLAEMKKAGVLDAGLLYNLGNCAASQEKYGEALAWYEQARRLAPRDSDIIENRNFVWRKIKSSELTAYESAGPLDMLERLIQKLRPDEWLVVAALWWVVLFCSLAFNRFKRRGFPVGAVICSLFVVISLWFYFSLKTSLYEPHSQAIVVDNASVYKLPVASSERISFSAETGKYAQVIEEREVFCLVKIDQAEGWIEKRMLKFVWE